jgi:hypothetical protein
MIKILFQHLAVMVLACILALWRLKQEDHEFKVSLGHIGQQSFKILFFIHQQDTTILNLCLHAKELRIHKTA